MNKLKTIDREAVSWKFLFESQKVNLLKQFGKHYLDRGTVHASEITGGPDVVCTGQERQAYVQLKVS